MLFNTLLFNMLKCVKIEKHNFSQVQLIFTFVAG